MGDGDPQPPRESRVYGALRTIGVIVLGVASLVLRFLSIQADQRDDDPPAAVPRDPGVQVRTVAPGTWAAFKSFVGGTPDQTPARFGAVTPRSYKWRGGERIVVCYAEGRNGVPLTSSMRNAATRGPP